MRSRCRKFLYRRISDVCVHPDASRRLLAFSGLKRLMQDGILGELGVIPCIGRYGPRITRGSRVGAAVGVAISLVSNVTRSGSSFLVDMYSFPSRGPPCNDELGRGMASIMFNSATHREVVLVLVGIAEFLVPSSVPEAALVGERQPARTFRLPSWCSEEDLGGLRSACLAT
ncbi:hypothetical protein VTI74DRAFT_1478 [Chaetomium olivicolor]